MSTTTTSTPATVAPTSTTTPTTKAKTPPKRKPKPASTTPSPSRMDTFREAIRFALRIVSEGARSDSESSAFLDALSVLRASGGLTISLTSTDARDSGTTILLHGGTPAALYFTRGKVKGLAASRAASLYRKGLLTIA